MRECATILTTLLTLTTWAGEADRIIDTSGVRGGLVVVLGSDAELLGGFGRGYMVQGLDGDRGAVQNTRWIDGLSYSFEERNPRYTVGLYRTVMWAGFVLRATVYALGFMATRKQLYKFNARSMFGYARHIMRRASSSS